MSVFYSVGFFLGVLKACSSNSFVMILISFEMMTLTTFLMMLSKVWILYNIHFFTSLLVFSVMEGVLGVSILVMLFSNSKIFCEGVWMSKYQ
uniref:NADH dehydrogenase subunit 4L n=1 Tax=Campanulotes compar TaxID=135595 RepID=Q2HJL6_9NEOP|nr:NADH dehydrogenase subunit 4L [Campanulotes compar]AAX53870.1 NADH dehydrogenase subunit 4L [Campanulotes compar]AYD72943.1 NADH dehydrogenase subunit 4L [Campanulotes compar]UTT72580.1 NADH dehydrogenase subunit 4L [Campanulotes compar]